MRGILMWVGGVVLVTYSWGWYLHVQRGPMDTSRYTAYYLHQITDTAHAIVEKSGNLLNFAKKPIPRRGENTFFS